MSTCAPPAKVLLTAHYLPSVNSFVALALDDLIWDAEKSVVEPRTKAKFH